MFLPLICDTCSDLTVPCDPAPAEGAVCYESLQASAAQLTSAATVAAKPQPAQQSTPQFSPSPVLLGRGSQGAQVTELQTKLTQLGYDPGPNDGIFGRQTEAAVRRLQTDYALSIDGVVGPQTNDVLSAPTPPTPVLSRDNGSSGPAVVALQTQLKALGHDPGPIDGRFGPQTQAAVIAFQQSAQLAPNGVVGAETQAKLQSEEAGETIVTPETDKTEELAKDPEGTTVPLEVEPVENLPVEDSPEDLAVEDLPRNARESPDPVQDLPQMAPSEADPQETESRTSARDLLQPVPREAPDEDVVSTPESEPASTPDLLDTPPTTAQPRTEWPLLRPLAATGGVLLFVAGWVGVLKHSRKTARPKGEIEIEATPSPSPIVERSQLPEKPIDRTLHEASPIEPHNTVLSKAQTLVATLVPGHTDRPYAYSLIDDAKGRFTLVNNKLWMKRQQSNAPPNPHTIVLRCTDANGHSTDKVFEIAKAAV